MLPAKHRRETWQALLTFSCVLSRGMVLGKLPLCVHVPEATQRGVLCKMTWEMLLAGAVMSQTLPTHWQYQYKPSPKRVDPYPSPLFQP